MLWILVFGLLVVAVILIRVGFKDNGRREPFSASDDTVEMPMDPRLFYRAITYFKDVIVFLNYIIKDYEVDVCTPFRDIRDLDFLLLSFPLFSQAQIAKYGSATSDNTIWKATLTENDKTMDHYLAKLQDDIRTYVQYQFDRMWTMPKKEHGFAECFEDSKPRTVSLEQQTLTTELERLVIITEDLMNSDEMSQILKKIKKAQSAYTFLVNLTPPNIVRMNDVFSNGDCPDGMYAFNSGRACCPVKPTDAFTKCPVEKLDTSVACSIKSGHPTLPTCRPVPSQGPCLPDYFLFAESKGGQCCPVHPADFDTTRGEYTSCPNVAKDGRTLCSLVGNNENMRPCNPPVATSVMNQEAEGFQTVGRALLIRAERIMLKVNRLVVAILTLERTKKEWNKPEMIKEYNKKLNNKYFVEFPAPSPTTFSYAMTSTSPSTSMTTSSPKISHSSPSP